MLGVLLPILFLEYEYDWAVFNMKAWCGMQSAKTNLNVENVFFTIARDIKNRVAESDSNHPAPPSINLNPARGATSSTPKSTCCA
jgi:hypothetical protein